MNPVTVYWSHEPEMGLSVCINGEPWFVDNMAEVRALAVEFFGPDYILEEVTELNHDDLLASGAFGFGGSHGG